MKIALIGSTWDKDAFAETQRRLIAMGNEVHIPSFDDDNGNELDVCNYNRALIEWADEVHVIWDGYSIGIIFDFGMIYALRKKLVIESIEGGHSINDIRRYFANAMRLYAEEK